MPEDEELRFFLLGFAILAVTAAALFAMNRLLPDRSLQCVQSGGNWKTDNDGHCERAAK
jgi:hypothetical protein